MYTKGEWKAIYSDNAGLFIQAGKIKVAKPLYFQGIRSNAEFQANAHLISAVPLGYKLAEFMAKVSTTWIDDGLLEIGEGDYLMMKKMALEFLSKARGGKE